MSMVRGFAHYEGLLPIEPSDEPPPLRPTILEDPFPNGQPSLRKRASRALSRFLAIFCVGVGTTLAWQSYGDAAREMIANSYPQLGWLAPRPLPIAQNVPDMIDLAAPAAQHLNAMSLDTMRQSIDGIAAGQEQTTRSTDQTATSAAQARSGKAIDITVESRADEPSLHPTARLDIEPTEARPPQTLSERGKQTPAASERDASCGRSAAAVLQTHAGGWASWTLPAPGHEGTICWYASARPRHR